LPRLDHSHHLDDSLMIRTSLRVVLCLLATSVLAAAAARAADVTGRIEMSAACAPEVSPAVVMLEPVDPSRSVPTNTTETAPRVISQRGMRFDPRVSALKSGQSLKFTNEDTETHNIHVTAPGVNFNASVQPGSFVEFQPEKPGVYRILCDVHSHMRGFAVRGTTDLIAACKKDGRFTIADVPPGAYRLKIWHELGDPLEQAITVQDGRNELPTIVVPAPPRAQYAGALAPVEPWAEVLDHISVTLTQSLEAAKQPGGRDRARRLAQDAYLGMFEASDMETAVRAYLGLDRSNEIESLFRKIIADVRKVAEKETSPSKVVDEIRTLFVKLSRASSDLDQKGITDRSKVLASTVATTTEDAPSQGDLEAKLSSLHAAFNEVQALADGGEAESASLALGDAYFSEFEPLETAIKLHDLTVVRRLETRFNALGTAIAKGERGDTLKAGLGDLRLEIETELAKTQAASGRSAFALLFAASLGLILREGLEVILLLTMLFALVAKAGQPKAMRALRWGVALAAVASAFTAIGLNAMVASAGTQSREMIEGIVLLLASGMLFYVSYWLISQSESKRWLDFLKRNASESSRAGGYLALGVTAFLAVYREGAETALLYQALLANQPSDGVMGVFAGLGVGLISLTILYIVIRRTSVKLPMRRFFQVSGCLLFAMAVVFAGHGVAELQTARIIKWTGVAWMGDGIPMLGIYPNVQCLAVQGMLLAGALLAFGLIVFGGESNAGSSDRSNSSPSGRDSSEDSARNTLVSATPGPLGV
jgi:high-affinity iron transporter